MCRRRFTVFSLITERSLDVQPQRTKDTHSDQFSRGPGGSTRQHSRRPRPRRASVRFIRISGCSTAHQSVQYLSQCSHPHVSSHRFKYQQHYRAATRPSSGRPATSQQSAIYQQPALNLQRSASAAELATVPPCRVAGRENADPDRPKGDLHRLSVAHSTEPTHRRTASSRTVIWRVTHRRLSITQRCSVGRSRPTAGRQLRRGFGRRNLRVGFGSSPPLSSLRVLSKWLSRQRRPIPCRSS